MSPTWSCFRSWTNRRKWWMQSSIIMKAAASSLRSKNKKYCSIYKLSPTGIDALMLASRAMAGMALAIGTYCGTAYAESEVTPGNDNIGPGVTIIQRCQETEQKYRIAIQLYMIGGGPAGGGPGGRGGADGGG